MADIKERYAFFLDIDNTLYVDGVVPEENIAAIGYARENGHKVFINTARSFCNMPAEINKLTVDGFITSIGTDVYIEGKHILSEGIPVGEAAYVTDYLEDHGMSIMYEGRDMLICSRSFDIKWDDRIVPVKDGNDMIRRFGNEIIGKSFIKGIVPPDIRCFLEERFLFFQHQNYAEFSLRGYSKATGIDYVAGLYGLRLESCVAMGDSDNDLDMLEHAGIAIAMGNANDKVKELCGIITCDARDGGVAEGIRTIIG